MPSLPRGVFEALPLGVVLFDAELRAVVRNSQAICLLPDSDDVPAALARDLVDVHCEDWAGNLRGVLRGGPPLRRDAIVLQHRTEPPRFVNLIAAAIMSDDASPRGGILIIEDVSARITMEQRLAVSERLAAIGKLCASVAHELNNPLDGILRYLNLSLRLSGSGDGGKLREYVQAARDGTVRLVHIVRSLLDFSRKTPPALTGQSIGRLLDEAVASMQARAIENNVTVVCHTPNDLPAIGGTNVFQVFCNLIKNAIDAMASGGTLTISATTADGGVVVTFTDTGTGLPEDTSQLFEPFFTTKAPGKGTGLGLAVCREIVDRLGGEITAENRIDQGGAVFTVRLPAGVIQGAQAAEDIEARR